MEDDVVDDVEGDVVDDVEDDSSESLSPGFVLSSDSARRKQDSAASKSPTTAAFEALSLRSKDITS